MLYFTRGYQLHLEDDAHTQTAAGVDVEDGTNMPLVSFLQPDAVRLRPVLGSFVFLIFIFVSVSRVFESSLAANPAFLFLVI